MSVLTWPFGRVPEVLPQKHVHVWAWTFAYDGSDLARHSALLSAAEQERAARFHFLRDQVQFATSRANMRRILSRYIRRPAEWLEFTTTPYGKPVLQNIEHEECRISFNLTHTAGVGLLAVGCGVLVGVDAEAIRPMDPEVAETHFSSSELQQLRPLQGEEWLHAFFTCWTRKEALLKAEGVGLNLPLADFDVSILPRDSPRLVGWRKTVPFSRPWRLVALRPMAEVLGALACSEDATVSLQSLVHDQWE